MALHIAIHVFAPTTSSRGGGLYPYRWTVYTLWIVFATLTASLAFINPNGYVSQGTACSLPIRPFWYRLALGWIPRYLILATIFAILLVMYRYVRRATRDIKRELGSWSIDLNGSTEDSLRDDAIPLKPVKRPSRQAEGEILLPQISVHGIEDEAQHPLPLSAFLSHSRLNSIQPGMTQEQLSFPVVLNVEANRQNLWVREETREPSSNTTTNNLDHESASDAGSVIGILHALGPPDPVDASAAEGPALSSRLSIGSHGQPMVSEQIIKTHKRILRQIRLLFFYPLVYFLTWIVPFVQHCTQYSDYYSQHPNFFLTCLSTVVLSLQCAIDCWVFSVREKASAPICISAPPTDICLSCSAMAPHSRVSQDGALILHVLDPPEGSRSEYRGMGWCRQDSS